MSTLFFKRSPRSCTCQCFFFERRILSAMSHWFLNLFIRISATCESETSCMDMSNGYSLSFVRGVNHGKQSSLFHSALRHGARAKSVFMVGIMAGRATSFENIVADQKGSQFHLQYLIYLRRKSSTPLKYLRKEIPLDIFDFFFFFLFVKWNYSSVVLTIL